MPESISAERAKTIKAQLVGNVRDGEEFVARWDDGKIVVEPISAYSPLRDSHPDLYGHLLSTSQQITDTPRNSLLFMGLLWFVACLVVGAGLIDELFGRPIEDFQHIGFYIGLAVICFIVMGRYDTFRQRAAYQRLRPDIQRAIAREGTKPETVLAWIESDKSVEAAAQHMKGDSNFIRGR